MARKKNKKIDCGLYRVRIYIGKVDGMRNINQSMEKRKPKRIEKQKNLGEI